MLAENLARKCSASSGMSSAKLVPMVEPPPSATVQSAVAPQAEPRRLALHITLCARYWHFLFAVWAVLFAALGWLTPEVVRFICGRA